MTLSFTSAGSSITIENELGVREKFSQQTVKYSTDIFKGVTESAEFTVYHGSGSSYHLIAMKSSLIPSIAIKITPTSTCKRFSDLVRDKSVSCTADIFVGGQKKSKLKSIKGRGNSTWQASKKPFKLKFKEETSLLNLTASTKFNLLANAYDASMIRNSIALRISDYLGFAYTPSFQSFDFYIDETYQGNYLLTESIEVGRNRVWIKNLDEENELLDSKWKNKAHKGSGLNNALEACYIKNSRKWVDMIDFDEVPTGGYLLEFDFCERYDEEASGFVTNIGQNVVLKSPEFASKKEVEYIASFYQEVENAIYSDEGCTDINGIKHSTGCNLETHKHYTSYIDMESFVKMYILLEYTMSTDAGLSSAYFYKKQGIDILFAGPAWDFDNSIKNDNTPSKFGFNLQNSNIWWANSVYYGKSLGLGTVNVFPTIWATLYEKHVDFRNAVTAKWQETSTIFSNLLQVNVIEAAQQIEVSAVMNALKWDLFDGSSMDAKRDAFLNEAEVIIDFIEERKLNLDIGFRNDSALLYYDSNGGEGYIYNDQIVKGFQHVTIRDPNIPDSLVSKEGYTFVEWNTKQDGSGKSYLPGEAFVLSKRKTVLYAQWEKITPSKSSNATVLAVSIVASLIFIGAVAGLAVFFYFKKIKVEKENEDENK